METDYSFLRGQIRAKCKTLAAFAEAIKVSNTALMDKLSGRSEFKQSEMVRALEVLDLPDEAMTDLFFTGHLRKTVRGRSKA